MSTGTRQAWQTFAAELRADGLSRVEIAGVLQQRFKVGALAALRYAHGWSQADAAKEWCKLFPDQLKTYKDFSAWETGRNTPVLGTLDQLAQLYRCDLADLLADRPGYRPVDDEVGTSARADQNGTSAAPDSLTNVDRRELLTALGTTIAGTIVVPLAGLGAPKDVPPELAEYFSVRFADHVAAHTRLGARPLIGTVITEYSSIRQAADMAAASLQGDLNELSVAYSNLVGWLYQDLGDVARSWRWRSESLELAHRSGDSNLVAYALAELALLRRDVGDGPGTVALTTAALATPGLPDTLRCFTLRQAAHAHSLTGDRDGVDQALDEAAQAVSRSDAAADERYQWGAPSWWGGTQDGNRAVCYLRLGDSSGAAELLGTTLARTKPDARRYRGITAARYAQALLELEGPEAAIAPATEAVSCFRQVGSMFLGREIMTLQQAAMERRDARGGEELMGVVAGVG